MVFSGITGAYKFVWVFMYVPRILFLIYLLKWLFLNRKNDTDASRRKLTHAFTFNFLAHAMTIAGVYFLQTQLKSPENKYDPAGRSASRFSGSPWMTYKPIRYQIYYYIIAFNFFMSIFWRNSVANWSNKRKDNNHIVIENIMK